jgi:hypothetical protein
MVTLVTEVTIDFLVIKFTFYSKVTFILTRAYNFLCYYGYPPLKNLPNLLWFLRLSCLPSLPVFLYLLWLGLLQWPCCLLTVPQRRRIEAAEIKLLRPLAVYFLYDYKTNDHICRTLQNTGILDKIDGYRRNWLLHLQRMPQNRIPLKSYHYRLQRRRTIGRPKKRWQEQL